MYLCTYAYANANANGIPHASQRPRDPECSREQAEKPIVARNATACTPALLHMASTLLHTLCEDKSKSCTTSATPANASEWPKIYGITFIQMMHILFIVNTFLRNRTPHFVSGQPEFRIGHCVCYFARNARRISVSGRICRE